MLSCLRGDSFESYFEKKKQQKEIYVEAYNNKNNKIEVYTHARAQKSA
jgi:hypothetical protein